MTKQDARLFWDRLRRQQIKTGFKSLKTLCEREGLSYQSLLNQKHTNRFPTVPVVIRLARALNCSINWLLTGKEFICSPNSVKIQKAIANLQNLN